MFNKFQEVETFFINRSKFGIKPGLDRMHYLLEKSGHPEKSIQAIHIAGTNGKGSTVQFIKNALQENNYRVGVFTSPSFNGLLGHFFINDQMITESAFIDVLNQIYPAIMHLDAQDMAPTEFEIITAMAFVYFENNIDLAVIEAGMGGRQDTTNCFMPILSIITNVAKDHTAFLGETISEIAYHKAGIIKQDKPVITAETNPEALTIMEKEASQLKTEITKLGVDFNYKIAGHSEPNEQIFEWTGNKQSHLVRLKMQGEHQVKNASLAVMALTLLSEKSFHLDWKLALEGIRNTAVPGRFEVVKTAPQIILDGAHNPAGIASLIETANEYYPSKQKHLLFAAFKDKDLKTMIGLLDNKFDNLTFTSFDHSRAAHADALFDLSIDDHKAVATDWQQFIEKILLDDNDPNACYFISGSLHFILQVRAYLAGM